VIVSTRRPALMMVSSRLDARRAGHPGGCCVGRAWSGGGDLARIEVRGERVSEHVRQYRPHDNIDMQYKWMTRGM